jgi:hypothetical protein
VEGEESFPMFKNYAVLVSVNSGYSRLGEMGTRSTIRGIILC